MKFSKYFKKAFSYTWQFYLLALLIPSIIFPLAYSLKNRPKNHQILSIFLPVELSVNNANTVLYDDLEDLNVRSTEIVSYDAYDNKLLFEQKVTVVAYNRCDILVLPEDKLEEVLIFTQALNINDEIKKLCNISDEKIYTNQEIEYGVEIPATSPLMKFGYFKNEIKYYAFLNGKSVNIGDYSLKSPHTENAFKMMQYALGKYEKE